MIHEDLDKSRQEAGTNLSVIIASSRCVVVSERWDLVEVTHRALRQGGDNVAQGGQRLVNVLGLIQD